MSITDLRKHLEALERDGFGDVPVMMMDGWDEELVHVVGVRIETEPEYPEAPIPRARLDSGAHLA